MRRALVVGGLLGLFLACSRTEEHCDQFVCADCRLCAEQSIHACRETWLVCDRDPECSGLEVCFDECLSLDEEYRAGCERQCRDAHPYGEVLYEQALLCVDETCAGMCQ